MILVNTDFITGKDLETLTLVKGSTIQSKNIGKDISQGFKTQNVKDKVAPTFMCGEELSYLLFCL